MQVRSNRILRAMIHIGTIHVAFALTCVHVNYAAAGDVCWRPTIVRGVGTPLTCDANEDYDAGLCYPKCQEGFSGVGPVCWKRCPAGYRDDPFHCAKDAYGRGVGTPMPCGEGKEQDAGLCYDRCNPNYNGVGPGCWQSCPEGFDDIGAGCEKPHQERGVGKPLHTCPVGKEQDAGLCYTPCSGGFSGVGPVCWRPCPADFPVNCGAACAKSNESCASSAGSQTFKTIETVIKLIMEDFKGAANSGVEAGKSFNLPLCTYGTSLAQKLQSGHRIPDARVRVVPVL